MVGLPISLIRIYLENFYFIFIYLEIFFRETWFSLYLLQKKKIICDKKMSKLVDWKRNLISIEFLDEKIYGHVDSFIPLD